MSDPLDPLGPQASPPPAAAQAPAQATAQAPELEPAGENTSFVKLAMRNMVRKGRQSLLHFGLTAVGLLGFIVLVAWLGRPQPPGG